MAPGAGGAASRRRGRRTGGGRLRLERASVALERALRQRPAAAESWLLLAFTHQALGKADTAAALARHALVLDPERPGLREAVSGIAGAP